jgi:hypothetical protein
MRKLHHPIVAFVVAVLVAIGIGVGVVAAVQSPKVYGPSWGRFSAVFPGHVYQQRGYTTFTRFGGGSGIYGGGSGMSSSSQSFTFRLSYFTYSNQPSGWFAYDPRGRPGHYGAYDRYSVSVGEGTQARLTATDDRNSFFGPGVTEDQQRANGLSITIIGPQCADGDCDAVEIVGNARIVWNVEAFWQGPASSVETLLASFQPIG